METQYSVKFLTSFVEHLQDVCRNCVDFNQFVEVSGYVCVEIDNMKKERYVLSELLQSSGNVVSESFCTKVLSSGSQKVRRESNQISVSQKKSFDQSTLPCSYDRSQPLQHQGYSPQYHSKGQQENRPFRKLIHVSETNVDPFVTPDTQPQSHHVGSPWKSGRFSGKEYEYKSSTESYPDSSSCDLPLTPVRHRRLQLDGEMAAVVEQDSVVEQGSGVEDEEEVIDLDMFEEDEEDVSILPVAMQEDDILRYGTGSGQQRKSQLSPGTLSTVRNSVKQFKKFIFDRSGLDTDLFSTPPERMNILLLDYFREARKVDGGELTARTLKNLQVRLDMFLKDGGYPFSIVKDKQFVSSRDYLKRRLSESGKSVSQLHSPVNDSDIEVLFQANQLGVHSCEIITNTMWFLNSKYFAIRRPAEHLNLKWGDLCLDVDEQGQEYITRPIQGSIFLKVCAKPEIPNRCFVNFYKQYQAMRPKQMMDEASPFYMKIIRSPTGEQGFGSEAMSYSHFIHIWRKMVQVSRLPSNKKIF